MKSISQGAEKAHATNATSIDNSHGNVGAESVPLGARASLPDGSYVELFDDSLKPLPPYTNRGGMGKSPLESTLQILTPPTLISAIVDYLSFTFSLDEVVTRRRVQCVKKQAVAYDGRLAHAQYDEVDIQYHGEDVEFIRDKTEPEVEVSRMLKALGGIVSNLEWIRGDRGLFGYTSSVSLYRDGKHCGKVAWGGNKGTCLVSLSGAGTSGVDMRSMQALMMRLPSVKITRVDLANDDLEGLKTVDDWLDAYEQGKFHLRGKMPGRKLIDDFGTGEGRTFYVGNLENGKEACIYEKGKQLGDKESKWLRVEGRMSCADRDIPLDVLLFPEMYLAGMYPAFNILCAFHERIEVIKTHTKIAFEHAVKHARLQVGRLVHVLQELGKSSDEIVAMLHRYGVPKRLMIPLAA